MKTYSCGFIFAPRDHYYILGDFLENVLIDYLNKNHMTLQGSELIVSVKLLRSTKFTQMHELYSILT